MASVIDPIVIIFTLLFGLAFGSFGTMLLHRMPLEDTLGGRSKCPQCSHTLAWYDLLPVISYCLLIGRCRYCRQRISYVYPIFEIMSGVLSVALIIHERGSVSTHTILFGIAMLCLLLIAFHDYETRQIPDVFVIVLFLTALISQALMSISSDHDALRSAFIGASIPFAFFGVLWIASGGTWIGSGDILLGCAIGLLLGMRLTLVALFLAYIIGAVVASWLLLTKQIRVKETIAFGPFLSAGAIMSFLFGERLTQFMIM